MIGETLRRFHRRYFLQITMWTMIVTLIGVYFSAFMVVQIPAGHAAAVWRRFGGGTDTRVVLREGISLIWPWDIATIYDMRLQMVTETYDAITKDGLAITATIAFRYRLDLGHLGVLHKNVGPDYLRVMVIPRIGSDARALISQYVAEDFYSYYRDKVQQQLLDRLTSDFQILNNDDHDETPVVIRIQDALIKQVTLPERVATAIEQKQVQYQRQLQYQYQISAEEQEAKRKSIEAAGIRRFFDLIGSEQLPDYLRWRGIDATVQLAQSPNAKIVVVGNGPNGLPLILGNLDTPGPSPLRAPPTADAVLTGGAPTGSAPTGSAPTGSAPPPVPPPASPPPPP
ncbi:MAG: prohibitin family protein [Azospirillaceae bacterium]|nr:prohibitin family protein [Azospirillaceae bacterium]